MPMGEGQPPLPRPTPVGGALLDTLLATNVVLMEDWEQLSAALREEIRKSPDTESLIGRLVEHSLVTPYQASRIAAGKLFGLVLGNHRVLERIGAGGMGVVYKGEHIRLRSPVALKVLTAFPEHASSLLHRFYTEMRAVAQLHHPHIVGAVDAGEVRSPNPDAPVLHYFVMEYVSGRDLEEWVETEGPLPQAQACTLAYQVASALAEAHRHNLVHRDIKPSNIRVTPEGQAKLLDFGLALHFRHRMTEPGTMLGTVDYLAPEQARDASTVDIRADIYSLGGTLFWCLTGQAPFEMGHSLSQDMVRRLSQPPPSVRSRRPEIPKELDALVARMMALDPAERFPAPQSVMQALLAFVEPASPSLFVSPHRPTGGVPLPTAELPASSRTPRILIVDDEAGGRALCRCVLEGEGMQCDEAVAGDEGLQMVRAADYDLMLLDIDLPRMTGWEVLRRLRADPPSPHLKVLMISGRAAPDEMAKMLCAGADDYLAKPFTIVQLVARIKAALHLKAAQEHSDWLTRHLLSVNAELERNLQARDTDLIEARNTLVLALAKLVEYRDVETRSHLVRMQRYCRCLGEEAAGFPAFANVIDENFLQMLDGVVPLHDIGKVGLPDEILLKPGKLTQEEHIVMQAHTTIGADILAEVAKEHGFGRPFWDMAIAVIRHHHERWDGTGYPDRLAGANIPLGAQLVSVCDVYDALRSRRGYKPALPHAAVVQLMSESTGQFNPLLQQAFQRCAARFERIHRELPG